jgi:hypothetical protein
MKVTPELYSVKITKGITDWDYNSKAAVMKEWDRLNSIGFIPMSEIDLKPEVYDEDGKVSNQADYRYVQLIESDMLVVSADQMIALSVADIEFKVNQRINVEVSISKQLQELCEKPFIIEPHSGTHNTYNNKVNVHMPGNMLSMYNETMLLEDACTDDLQTELNRGFRIIAAMPQPDQRRPDYVLGRFNPNKQIDGMALRKGDE